MGLDQYAYVAAREKERDAFYEQDMEFDGKDWVVPEGGTQQPRELAYWRKHPNLQGWMEALYHSKGGNADFNGQELELTWEDLERLEQDILNGSVAQLGTRGFFFGDASDEYYREQDLAFVKKAKAELFCGLRVFYNSSW
jgi:hypothetical protein